MEGKVILDVVEIQKILPHRYPFLMLDRVVEFEDNKRVVGIKNVTVNESFFMGHFPGRPVMPGVMQMEAMAQTGAILALRSSDGVPAGKIMLLVGIDSFRWKRQVVPGDVLRIEMVFVKRKRPLWVMDGTVTVDGHVVAAGRITAAEG